MIDERFAITEKEKEKVLNTYFTADHTKLKQFPSKEKRKIVVLQQIITDFEQSKTYTEKEVNAILKTFYDDFATIRRYLIEYGFLDRNRDCSQYWVKR